MPFPSNTDTNANTAADRLIVLARQIRADAVKYIAQCDAASVNAHDLISAFCVNHLVPSAALWATMAAVPGVAAVIRQRFPGQFASDADVTTALNAAQAAMDATINYVVANTPKDNQEWVLTLKVVNNAFEQRIVTTSGAINPLRAQLIALRDAFSA